MPALRGLTVLATAAILLRCAFAATINVGGPNGGWDQSTDLKTWAASQKFAAGDTLLFKYSALHSVLEVSKAGYDACRTSGIIAGHSDGNTAIPLLAPGNRYFICGTPGHCDAGMKLEVKVVSAVSAAPPPVSTAIPASPRPVPAPRATAKSPSSSSTPAPASPSPRMPNKSPSPTSPATPSPSAPKNSPSPSSQPNPAASAEPSGSPPVSTPTATSPTGSLPGGTPSAAGRGSESSAAGFVCGLLMLLSL